MPTPTESPRPPRPATRDGFSIVIICALPLEASAVLALFDHHWDNDGPPFDKAPGDPNAYSTGTIGRHNVVVAHMPGMGKVNSATVANSCRMSFINIKLALLVGITGIVPFDADGKEIFLGDVIISEGVIQYDLGRQYEDRFTRKNALLDSLGRPNAEIRAILAKLKGLRARRSLRADMAGYLDTLRLDPLLAAEHPGIEYDMLFEANHQRLGENETGHSAGRSGTLVQRRHLEDTTDLQPAIHFGLIASGDLVMRSGKRRDDIAREEGVIAFESESAGIWDTYPCVVIKGGCNYADGHEDKRFQMYSAATAAACMKAFLRHWVPSQMPQLEQVSPQMAMEDHTPLSGLPQAAEALFDSSQKQHKPSCFSNTPELSLRDQWHQLVLNPLSSLSTEAFSPTHILVVDALGECGIRRIMGTRVQDFALQDIPQETVDKDIASYLKRKPETK